MPRLLAIDDDPGRYDGLRRYIEGCGVDLDVACCAPCVARLLPGASAVLLDFDLDGAEACSCGLAPTRFTNGGTYVAQIAARRVPVVMTSASSSSNRRWLARQLAEHGVPYVAHSAADPDPEDRWIGALWRLGAI